MIYFSFSVWVALIILLKDIANHKDCLMRGIGSEKTGAYVLNSVLLNYITTVICR